MAKRIRWHRLAALPVLVAALLGQAGCGSGAQQGQVSGTVTCQGVAVAEGIVSFTNSAEGAGAEGEVKDGAYRLSAALPPGEYVVTVLPRVVRQQEDGKGPVIGVDKWAPGIPEKYRTTGTTDLKRTVTAGPNQIDLDLKKR